VHGALGDRIFLSKQVALRFEVRGIYAPSTQAAFGPSWAGHVVGSLGLSAFFGGEARDLDGDGVADRRMLPRHARGAIVDAKGCPTDADGDGITTDWYACPNTPMGAHVTRAAVRRTPTKTACRRHRPVPRHARERQSGR